MAAMRAAEARRHRTGQRDLRRRRRRRSRPGTRSGPSRIGAYQRRGALSTLALVAARVPFQAMFNVTGQPAAVVPWGLDDDGIPTSIQLVGRPFDEATLLSLSGADRVGPAVGAARRPPVES